ncbi:CG18273, partial [Drosophila busckii]
AELKTWLQDDSKEYTARVEFALKIWQSMDFVYMNKYEIVCQWLAATIAKRKQYVLPVQQLQQLFKLRAQPGLVNVSAKTAFIEALLKRISKSTDDAEEHPQLLQSLLNFELMQDVLRANYMLLMSCYGQLFESYEYQLLNGKETTLRHAEIMLPLLQQLRECAQRAQRINALNKAYAAEAVQPLCELVIVLRERQGFDCVEQLAALEQQLVEQMPFEAQLQRLAKQPLHVRLLLLECALLNRRYDALALHELLTQVCQPELDNDLSSSAPESLALLTHALASLRLHNIALETRKGEASMLELLSAQLLRLAREQREQHLREVLLLLCTALRLNPLLLEAHVYQLTVWLLTAHKRTPEELQLYAEYLVLLLDMFRRLSRAERFVMQLLKWLKEWLSKYALNESSSKRSKLETEPEQELDENFMYVQLMYQAHVTATTTTVNLLDSSSERLAQQWPSSSAGAAFTRLISQLMSKPSLVIWKMLLHNLADLLQPAATDDATPRVLPENLDFALEFQAALLCQYLQGTRLAEQVAQHGEQLQQQLGHTAQVLQQFAQHLLAREHNRRTITALLECVERASGFELMLNYYWPAGLAPPTEQQQHRFLPHAEWDLIQQRVHNFGKNACRLRLQRLELQLLQAGWLLQPTQTEAQSSCTEALLELLPGPQLGRLTREEKQLRLQRLQQRGLPQVLQAGLDGESVELLTLELLQEFVAAAGSKHMLLAKLLKQSTQLPPLDLAKLLLASSDKKSPQLTTAATDELLAALQQLPLLQLVNALKARLWLLLLALQVDLQRAQLKPQAQQLLELLIDMLHFGQALPLCSYLPQLDQLLQLLPLEISSEKEDENETETNTTWRFYETFFTRCIRRLGANSENFLTSCVNFMRAEIQESRSLSLEHCRLLLLVVETLAAATGVQARRNQRQLQPFLELFGQLVLHKFRSQKKAPEVYKEFVQRTLSGYTVYLSNCINRWNKQQQEKEKENVKQQEQEKNTEQQLKKKEKKKEHELKPEPVQPIDENCRRICKIYIGHSLNYRNPHAIRLLNVALTYRQLLHLDQDEIEFVLSSYWQQLNADIASDTALDIQSIEPAIKLIIGYKTNEDFLLLLRRLSTQLAEMARPETPAQHTSLQNVITLLTLFAKCSLSSIKGAMLNEQFELISGNVGLRLPPVRDVNYRSHVLRLLEAQRALASNRTVPLTGETLDSLLASMLQLNIKRFILAGSTWTDFVELHGMLSENCLVLLRQQSSLMLDRAAQLSALIQDLVQGIVCYRSERNQAQSLNETEVDGLAELALKLASLMAGIAAGPQALALKRVAPFLLVFTIKQMVASERPTTLYEKIKLHMDRICHELIGICDHRSGHFILRASSEAGARLYQSLVKEHDKYHKFKGKV